MEDFKGTKGKWHIGQDLTIYDENGFDIAEASYPYRIKENYEELGFKHWADKKGISHVNTTDQETKANAQLIATAPELLESLSKLVEMLRSPCVINEGGFLYELDQETERAENIINKALGKED